MRWARKTVVGCRRGLRPQTAFTLIELLVVISIIGVMMALLFPAVNAARESGRGLTCMSNLRQMMVGMSTHADRFGTYCSGAFDWNRDGAVTETGWVADMVQINIPVGDMLCPSNPRQIAETYNDLLTLDTKSFDACVDRLGNPATVDLAGKTVMNPCRRIDADGLAPMSAARRQLVQDEVYGKKHNTNYTASWWLARSGAVLDADGNVSSRKAGCAASLTSRSSTFGPLAHVRLDAAGVASCYVPLLGCGGVGGGLKMSIGTNPAGMPTTPAMTAGPVVNPTMQMVTFPSGTPQAGPTGWWAVWQTLLQDYRAFGPVHRGACNLLFADGSVRPYFEITHDGVLNNGFQPSPQNGFGSAAVELPATEVFSGGSL